MAHKKSASSSAAKSKHQRPTIVPMRFPRLAEGTARVWDSRAFLEVKFPPREPLVVIDGSETPVFTKHSINQIFATRGTGKSMLALALAGAHSTGGRFLNWRFTRPAEVLYVDGELPNPQIQERMKLLHSHDARIRIITLDNQPDQIPPLDTAQGQDWLEAALGNTEVLILDSIATLAPFSTNDEDKWIPFIVWLQKMRSRGLCIYLLHQAGKAGLQRGHSRGDDPLDVQIKLKAREEDADYLNFDLTYVKFRGLRSGVHAISVDFSGEWKWRAIEEDKLRVLQEYLRQHPAASLRSISRALPQLGSHVTVRFLLNKLKQKKG